MLYIYQTPNQVYCLKLLDFIVHETGRVKTIHIIDYMFVFVEAVFVAPRSEELGIAAY